MRAFLSRISPLNNATSIRRPLLVVQGLNDPRVPSRNRSRWWRRCARTAARSWYLAAKDEGHGFRKKSNRDVYLETMALFLQRLAAESSPQRALGLVSRLRLEAACSGGLPVFSVGLLLREVAARALDVLFLHLAAANVPMIAFLRPPFL